MDEYNPTPADAGILAAKMDEQQAQQEREAAVKAKLAEMRSGGYGVCLEKYWGELTPEEKIERMREHVKYAAATIEQLREIVDRLTAVFPQHQHGQSGEVLIRALDAGSAVQQAIGYGLERMAKSRGEEVYF